MKVFIVQGVHPFTPGCPMTGHRTLAEAKAEALILAHIIMHDLNLPHDATLEKCLAAIKKSLLARQIPPAEGDVWITPLNIK